PSTTFGKRRESGRRALDLAAKSGGTFASSRPPAATRQPSVRCPLPSPPRHARSTTSPCPTGSARALSVGPNQGGELLWLAAHNTP
ncbi:hypothetical protein EMIHUDRAFT_449455, partial [Emiliania huxleyi CCMP1516]|uniref:Uncharacterized protein n=2 Tax=Emiliania huxleyi TaxID=2903 RepID=A0A0D3K881_EMIH1